MGELSRLGEPHRQPVAAQRGEVGVRRPGLAVQYALAVPSDSSSSRRSSVADGRYARPSRSHSCLALPTGGTAKRVNDVPTLKGQSTS